MSRHRADWEQLLQGSHFQHRNTCTYTICRSKCQAFHKDSHLLPVYTQPWPSKTYADCEASSARIPSCPELFSSTRFYIHLLCRCKGIIMHINFSGKVKPKSIISPFFVLIYSSEQVLLQNTVSRVENLKEWNNHNILVKRKKKCARRRGKYVSKYLLTFTHLLTVRNVLLNLTWLQ